LAVTDRCFRRTDYVPDDTLNPLLPVLLPTEPVTSDPVSAAARLLSAFLAGRSPATVRGYAADMRDFAAFCSSPTAKHAAARLLGSGPGAANELALHYKAHLVGRGMAANTVNRRLAALRSLVKLARTLGLVGWALEVEGVPSRSYRDTAGPGVPVFRRMIARLGGRTDAKGVRDRAVLRLLFDLALRRKEVVGLDVGDLDLKAGTVAVLGKGRAEKARLTLPASTQAALEAWLAVRGSAAGPLFTSLDRAQKGDGRLTGGAVYALVRRLGEAEGVKVRPHGLRHSAVTAALDAGLDVRQVRRFSRHARLDTLLVYDDNRNDLAGDVARRVAAVADDITAGC
jgi:integrase/recombinase XerC